jgi:lysozyme family protein
MADFLPAYERMIKDEGGYKLHKVEGDRGGQTYAGIARNYHARWPGWDYIDRGEIPPSQLVRDFYVVEFWNKIRGDHIRDQRIAETIFNFAVNADWRTAAKIAQAVVGVTPDGLIGDKTLAALNSSDPALFEASFALGKLKRYAEIVNRDRSQGKFLLGWVNRLLRGLA